MTYWEVRKLPLRTFWSLNRQIDRLRAEQDQRQLRITLAAASNGEAVSALIEDLRVQLESPVVIEKKFDEAKFDEIQNKLKNGAF